MPDAPEADFAATLRAAPRVDLRGLVGPDGAGGEGSLLTVPLLAWRVGADGPVRRETLVVERDVTPRARARYLREIIPHTILDLRARYSEAGPGDTPRAYLESNGGVAMDWDLEAVRTELLGTVTHADPYLGTLTYDRACQHCAGGADWGGTAVEVRVEPSWQDRDDLSPAAPPAAPLAAARGLWDDPAGAEHQIRDAVMADPQILPLFNDWREQAGERPLTPDAFRAALTPLGVTAWEEDGGAVWEVLLGVPLEDVVVKVRGKGGAGPDGAELEPLM